MFKITTTAIAIVGFANIATANQTTHEDSRISQYCGADHQNELASADDVELKIEGYTVKSLGALIDPRDPRVVPAFVSQPYLCTDGASSVKYLFVPSADWGDRFEAP